LKAISKAQEVKRRQEQQADEDFYKNHEPLTIALGLGTVNSEVKRKIQESSDKHLGPGRFGAADISHRDWVEKMLRAPLTEEEQAHMNKLDEENELDDSEEGTDDEMLNEDVI